MEELDELVKTIKAEISKAQSYLEQDLITTAQFDVIVARARRSFEQSRANLFARLEEENLTNDQSHAGSSSSSFKGASADPAPAVSALQKQSRTTSDASVGRDTGSSAPKVKRKRGQSYNDSDGGLFEGKRQRRATQRLEVGDESIYETSEYQRSDQLRLESQVTQHLRIKARSYLPDEWKSKKGLGEHKDTWVFVHPEGERYRLKNNPQLGVDFFTSPQDAFDAYIEGQLRKYTREGDENAVVRMAATLRDYLQDQHAIQQPPPVEEVNQTRGKRDASAQDAQQEATTSSNANRTPARASGSSSSSAPGSTIALKRRRASTDSSDDHALQETTAGSSANRTPARASGSSSSSAPGPAVASKRRRASTGSSDDHALHSAASAFAQSAPSARSARSTLHQPSGGEAEHQPFGGEGASEDSSDQSADDASEASDLESDNSDSDSSY